MVGNVYHALHFILKFMSGHRVILFGWLQTSEPDVLKTLEFILTR